MVQLKEKWSNLKRNGITSKEVVPHQGTAKRIVLSKEMFSFEGMVSSLRENWFDFGRTSLTSEEMVHLQKKWSHFGRNGPASEEMVPLQ